MHKMNRIILSVTLLVLQVTSLCSALECFQTCLENCNTGICAGRCGKALGSTGQFQLPGFISVFCNETEGDSCVNTEVFSLFGNTGDGEWLSLPRGCLFDYVDSKVRELQLLLNLGTQLFSCETDGCNIPSLAACTLAQATAFTQTGDITNPCYATLGRSVFEDKVRGGPHDIDMRGRCVNDLIISTDLVQVDQNSPCFANKQEDGATATPTCTKDTPPVEIDSISCSECELIPNCDINSDTFGPTAAPHPTNKPTNNPTKSPTTHKPTKSPVPTHKPTHSPTKSPASPTTNQQNNNSPPPSSPGTDVVLLVSVIVAVLVLLVLVYLVFKSSRSSFDITKQLLKENQQIEEAQVIPTVGSGGGGLLVAETVNFNNSTINNNVTNTAGVSSSGAGSGNRRASRGSENSNGPAPTPIVKVIPNADPDEDPSVLT